MAIYFDDFSAATNWTFDPAPTWTNDAATTWSISGGTLNCFRTTTANNEECATYNPVDSDADRAACEVLAKFKWGSAAGAYHPGPCLRASGAAAAENGYWCGAYGDELYIVKMVGGSRSAVANTTDLTLASNTDYWVRFRANGTSLKARIWADGESEPGTWNIDTTDSSVSAAGYVGVFSGTQSSDDPIFDAFGVGTNGDTAPSSATATKNVSQLLCLGAG